jgi:hypothetical protein
VRISFGMLVIIGGALFARLLVRSRITASGEVAQFALDTAIVRLGRVAIIRWSAVDP